MPREGAVNNKKKLKYCAESNQWISFSQWKKHKIALAQIAEARQNQAACNYETVSWNPLQDKVNKQEAEISSLRNQLNRAKFTLNSYRETLGSAGRLLAALVDVSEIN
jgi:hypothetical protein